ncbi:D-isomer specific 2-hydroxyacid dehydrogenase [Sodiomyces alkalinus F11]|uniref:D-isomer specific 2-hydroxyacid dehydrogenase n=1 Tax=Sodiomyces alkalinus (strain CBS 110278 / VKM F-3762 / F11) TaxID=1314773 RepID=A0A3N2Q320_SODAK|nr:D-isomer specific 2-hydroxyacid dehydrogenase [Sodiomyces alkalinus F11]ROT41164.1 D-isomer specific 2-hydroxyacid dehydrogenase [Sodiomyces alkalinus F11]
MGQPKVLQLGYFEQAPESLAEIGHLAQILRPKATTRPDFIEECKSGAFDEVSVIFRTLESAEVTGRFDEELVASLPPSVKFVCHHGAGYDSIDVQACTKQGISVSNVPTAVDDATADTAIFLMLGALRNFNIAMTSLRKGEWDGNPPPAMGRDPQGKTLGILGMGGIGRNMAKKALAFGMRIQYYNRTRLSPELERECHATHVDREELYRTSDVLSLNLPLNKHTRHTVSDAQFAMMKKGVVIVNTARGAVIDEAALVRALESGIVDSVGLDVFENEPEIHPGLLSNPRAILLPHKGTYTVETEKKMAEWVLDNVRLALLEGRLKSIVPEQAKH